MGYHWSWLGGGCHHIPQMLYESLFTVLKLAIQVQNLSQSSILEFTSRGGHKISGLLQTAVFLYLVCLGQCVPVVEGVILSLCFKFTLKLCKDCFNRRSIYFPVWTNQNKPDYLLGDCLSHCVHLCVSTYKRLFLFYLPVIFSG